MATCPNIKNPQWRFEQLGSPAGWLRQADLLKESADTLLRHGRELWESIGKQAQPGDTVPSLSIDQSVLMYLYALVIENVVKGIIVARNPVKLESGKLAWSRDGHRLRELFADAGIPFKDKYQEQLICEQLQSFLDWAGRYPIPKDKDTLMKSRLFYQAFLATGDFQPVYDPLRDTLVCEIRNASGP